MTRQLRKNVNPAVTMVRCTSWRSFFQLLFSVIMVGMYYVTKGRQGQSMGCVSLAIIYTHHVPFPHRLSCTWKSNPSRQQAKTFAFLSHTGVLEAKIFVGKETTCIIMGTSLVNWLRTCIFTASTCSRRGGGVCWMSHFYFVLFITVDSWSC